MADNKIHPDEHLIQRKAYELWQLRGCPAGNPERDWFEAVRLLTTAAQPKPEPQTDVASVRADAVALATQVQHAPAAAEPAAAQSSTPAEPLQNGFKALTKGTKASRKIAKG
jgi:hypothetical protein